MRREMHRFGAATRRPREDVRLADDVELAERIRTVLQAESGPT
jgi:hypothetical protein